MSLNKQAEFTLFSSFLHIAWLLKQWWGKEIKNLRQKYSNMTLSKKRYSSTRHIRVFCFVCYRLSSLILSEKISATLASPENPTANSLPFANSMCFTFLFVSRLSFTDNKTKNVELFNFLKYAFFCRKIFFLPEGR